MNCPSCGAGMRLETDREFFLCEYRGSVYFPEANSDGVRVLGEPAALACPACAIALVHASVGDGRILYCTRCRGMLIPMDRFMAIIQDLRSHRQTAVVPARPPDWTDLERHIRCPQCGQNMDAHPYGGGGGVIIDACDSCSLDWLDYGELERIADAPDRQYSEHAWDPV
ncbi:MAG: zf-TFIIB domain-containing protein [Acidobacteriia bacterium]|nr:zf-TFIIB domain-containing protein [Terriglobia bacterium]